MKSFKLTTKAVYKELWQGRKFELTHLWQRSVFLAAFMLAIAGAYGTVLMKIVFPDNSTDLTKDKCEIKTQDDEPDIFKEPFATKTQQEILIGLTCLGSVFSLLWCMMAKGSKYWFERYEDGIQYFTTGDYASELRDFDSSIPYHGNLPKAKDENVSDNPLSPLAGRYSVSKVNITIGIVSLLVWGILGIYHVNCYIKSIWKIKTAFYSLLPATFFFISFSSVAYLLLKFLCHSNDEGL